ncbi:hypothetical protein [Granulicella arctica]|uniref:Uncharacterized protein n=1 Tax=Granulicella arctica TaxID=940613 RepID=A0A7Y9PJY2_9BACT|nr:hypothetical protein [Granulicella arctica]NYF81134.1 hypothetical protein [Granulicella arctica]
MPPTRLLVPTLIAAFATTLLFAQQPATPNPTPTLVEGEVQIDHSCRVLTPARPNAHDQRPHFRYNSIVCHIESDHTSDHWEQTPSTTPNGRPVRKIIVVSEREYLLQNVSATPVTFVVTQTLRKGWRIDSDPQPAEVTPTSAVFRVQAQPGQIVRLHVGARS